MADARLLSTPPVGPVAHGLAALLERLPRRRSSLAILTYHRIAPARDRPDLHPGLRVDPDAFAHQIRLVAERAHPVSLAEVIDACSGGARLPARAVHVTVDDAYACVEDHAWPVLRAAGVPATLFVPTAHPDSTRTFWWDRLHHALRSTSSRSVGAGGCWWSTEDDISRAQTFALLRRRVSTMAHGEAMALVDAIVDSAEVAAARPANSSWAALRRMAGEGLALAPHSRTHPRLDRIDPDRLDEEVAGSWDDLRSAVGAAASPAFAPPGGGVDDAVRAVVRRAGMAVVMTTERGVNRGTALVGDDLRRINVGPHTPTGLVRIQLCPEVHAARAGAAAACARASAPLSATGG